MSSKRRHMSPLAILVESGSAALLAIARLFFSRGDETIQTRLLEVLAIWLLVTVLVVVPRYLSTTYQLTDDMIIMRKGIFRRQLIQVTYARIQTVGHQQWFFMRPFKIEQITIETAAHQGDEPEIKLTAVPLAVGEFIAQHQAAQQGGTSTTGEKAAATTPTAAPIWQRQLDFDALTLYALTSLGFIPMALVLLTGWRYADDLPMLRPLLGGLTTKMSQVTMNGRAILPLILVLLALVFVAGFFSMVGTMMRYWRFSSQYDGRAIHVTRGLLQQTKTSASTQRIQALRYQQNILRTLIGSGTASVLLAAGADDDDEASQMTVMPLLKHRLAWQELRALAPWLPQEMPALETFKTGYLQLIRNTVLCALVIMVPCLIWLRPFGYLSLLLLPISLAFGWFAAWSRGLALTETAAYVTTGSTLERTELFFQRRRVQSLEVKQSWWMRRAQLCHIVWHLRQGNGDLSVTLRYVPATVGTRVWAWYHRA